MAGSLGPARVGARFLGTGLPHTGAVHADQAQPILRGRFRQQAGLQSASGATVIVDDQRPVRISDFEIFQCAAICRCHYFSQVIHLR